MKKSIVVAVGTVLLLAGCRSAPRAPARAVPDAPSMTISTAEAAEPEPVVDVPSAPSRPSTGSPTPAGTIRRPEVSPPPSEVVQNPVRSRNEMIVAVNSEPSGAVVVVDGRPLGHTPVSIILPVTSRGFLAREVSVKVRFIAKDENGTSNTIEVALTPLDRAPSRLDFTPTGSRRTLAGLR